MRTGVADRLGIPGIDDGDFTVFTLDGVNEPGFLAFDQWGQPDGTARFRHHHKFQRNRPGMCLGGIADAAERQFEFGILPPPAPLDDHRSDAVRLPRLRETTEHGLDSDLHGVVMNAPGCASA